MDIFGLRGVAKCCVLDVLEAALSSLRGQFATVYPNGRDRMGWDGMGWMGWDGWMNVSNLTTSQAADLQSSFHLEVLCGPVWPCDGSSDVRPGDQLVSGVSGEVRCQRITTPNGTTLDKNNPLPSDVSHEVPGLLSHGTTLHKLPASPVVPDLPHNFGYSRPIKQLVVVSELGCPVCNKAMER